MLHVFLPDELITEVLSFLPVRSLMRLKCVCKSWKTLISDSTFVKLHLKRSARIKHLAIFSKAYKHSSKFSVSLLRLLEDASVTITDNPYFQLKNHGYIYPIGCTMDCSAYSVIFIKLVMKKRSRFIYGTQQPGHYLTK